MTASEEAKRYGFKSLKPVIERSKEARQTLNDWNIKRPRRLQLILYGLKFEQMLGDLPKMSYDTRKALETYTDIERMK